MSSDDRTDPELARGLMYIHQKLGDDLFARQEVLAHVYALTESLVASGTIALREFEIRKARANARLREELTHWERAQVLTEETDKYDVEPVAIDCAARIHLCKAACCRRDVWLSRQDLHEAVVRWDVGRPYAVRKRDDGTCTHSDKTTKRCHVYDERPVMCRRYDCRNDPHIWEDFDQGIPNPNLNLPR